MDKYKDEDIEVPSIDSSDIQEIVDLGVSPKKSFFNFLIDIYKELGFRNIFHDKNELIFIILIGIVIMGLSLSNIAENNIKDIYKATFITSPIIYIFTSVFSFYNSKEKGAFEIEMTCKYNLYQMIAIRMFIFSVLTAVMNTFIILFLAFFYKYIDIFRLICISIIGLFLFSSVSIYLLITFKNRFLKYLSIGGWMILNILFSSKNGSAYNDFLLKAPLYMHFIITTVCGFLYINNLNKFINFRREKGEI